MSQASPIASCSSSPSFNFLAIFSAALEMYEKTTKNKLLTHPLAVQLQSCDSPADILSVLEGLAQQVDKNRSNDQGLINWLVPTVNVLFAFSATLGEGVGLVFSPAKVIFAGIGVLLLAAKDVDASQDMLVDLLLRIENLFKRLESYTEVKPTPAMTGITIKIMVEVLTILGIATKEMKQRRLKKFLKKIMGKNDIEDALKRLDTLTREEARMATAEILKVTRCVSNQVTVLVDGVKETKVIMQQTASDVDEEKLKELRRELRKWLSPPDPSTNHNIARKVHHEGTATWFFQGSIFEQWKSSSSLLWVHGKPGSGKSVLCSGIIEDIMTQHDAGLATMAHFYCDFRDEDKQNCRNLLLSILSQLCAQSDPCFDILANIYSVHDDGTRKPSDDALEKCLTKMLSLPDQGPVYLIIDALDECPNNSGMPTAREEVLDLVKTLVGLHLQNLHVCVTSRPEIDIQTTLEPLTHLRVSLHNQTGQKKDIIDYITSVVSSDVKMRRWREEDRKLVIQTLSERADGMFRWVYCQLETLRHCLPPSIRGVLDELPETLDETYERVLRDINKANREHAHRLLHCLTVAIRPLRLEELAEVLAVDFDAARKGGIPKLNPDWRWADQHQAVFSTCSSLITIVDDEGSRVVQFSHFSVKEFLTSDRLAHSSEDVSRYHILLEPAHTLLAQACLGVLLRLDDDVNEDNAENIPLAEYAARCWVNHAQFEKVSSRIRETMEFFFDADQSHWAAWIRIYDISDHTSPLYYAALFGFSDLVEHLIGKSPEHVNARDGGMETPLMAALQGKHFRVADSLFRHGADVDALEHGNETLLVSVSWTGSVDTVQWLLDHGADANASGTDDFTSLHFAAFYADLESVQALLEHGADINARNEYGEVPLHLAASLFGDPHDYVLRDPYSYRRKDSYHRHLAIVQLLLDRGADVNARDNAGSTPLHHSSCRSRNSTLYGTAEGAHLLLKHGAKIDAKDNEGKTPLELALDHGHHEMARFLSEHDATRSA